MIMCFDRLRLTFLHAHFQFFIFQCADADQSAKKHDDQKNRREENDHRLRFSFEAENDRYRKQSSENEHYDPFHDDQGSHVNCRIEVIAQHDDVEAQGHSIKYDQEQYDRVYRFPSDIHGRHLPISLEFFLQFFDDDFECLDACIFFVN